MIDRDKHQATVKALVLEWVARREARPYTSMDELVSRLVKNLDAVIAEATVDGFNQGVQAVTRSIEDKRREVLDSQTAVLMSKVSR